jgi:hypothetical protein
VKTSKLDGRAGDQSLTPGELTLKRVREHLRNNIVGYIAQVVALSGSAYAVNGPLEGRNTVGSVDVIDNEVQGRDIKESSLELGMTKLQKRWTAVR